MTTSLCLFSFSSEEGRFGFGVDGFDREAEVVDVCWIDGERVAVSRATYIQCPFERKSDQPHKDKDGQKEKKNRGKTRDARPTPRHEPFQPLLSPSKHLFEVPSARTKVIDIVAPRGGREPLALLVG